MNKYKCRLGGNYDNAQTTIIGSWPKWDSNPQPLVDYISAGFVYVQLVYVQIVYT